MVYIIIAFMTRTLTSQTSKLIGKKVKLQGWVDSKRDHGKITFIDLRDRYGKVQIVGYKMLSELHVESVIEVEGMVKEREPQYVNAELPTGKIEIEVESYQLLNDCDKLPISLDSDGLEINEVPRLQYRYLDLRRSRLQNNLSLRSNLIQSFRSYLFKENFLEIETPLLTKSTKEGARDFLVPSRFQPGKFYALPQSPQQYKQLLMTAGFERYFQVARCVRDEDLRSDRGFEFTQLDLEMSFASQSDVMSLVESAVKEAVKNVKGKLQQETFPVITYQEAIEKYGEDKFDLRSEEEKEKGILAFAWVVDFPFFKKVDKADQAEVRDSKSGWTFTHNPFSAPQEEYLEDHLNQKNIENIKTAQYDLVCNGYEVGGGSIRAHDPEILKTTFKIMGYSDEEIEENIGHMLTAFKLGTPPHGGIALGLDRLVMLLANEDSLKETIAFPMSSTGRTSVMDAPSKVPADQLAELGLQVITQEGDSVHDKIVTSLISRGINFQYMSHKPVMTSQEAADERGTKLSQSAKALVLQADDDLILLIVPGDKQADLKKLQDFLKVSRLAMASKDTVKAKTGLEVGSIPPFGSIMGFKTYLDSRLKDEDEIAFNAGDHSRSVLMGLDDFIKVENPDIV